MHIHPRPHLSHPTHTSPITLLLALIGLLTFLFVPPLYPQKVELSAGPNQGVKGILPIANGGTEASNASAARANLGLTIGVAVQAWSANLDGYSTKPFPAGDVVGTTDTQTLSNKRYSGINCATVGYVLGILDINGTIGCIVGGGSGTGTYSEPIGTSGSVILATTHNQGLKPFVYARDSSLNYFLLSNSIDGSGNVTYTYTGTVTGTIYIMGGVGGGGGGSSAWGSITGTLASQTDLQSALNAKQNSLGYTPENLANKGSASGYAPLDSSAKVPLTSLYIKGTSGSTLLATTTVAAWTAGHALVPDANGNIVDSGSAPGGAPAFSAVTTGTNAAALHVGTGGSLDATGSGSITATKLGSGSYIPKLSSGTPSAIAFADIVSLWAGGSCSGYLKNDGTCSSTSGGSGTVTHTTGALTSGNVICGSGVTVDDIRVCPASTTVTILSTLQSTGGGFVGNLLGNVTGTVTGTATGNMVGPGLSTASTLPQFANTDGRTLVQGPSYGSGSAAPNYLVQRNAYDGAFLNDTGAQVYNVKSYGAVGNGVTNDYTAITTAITAACAASPTGATIFFPPGVYALATPLVIGDGTTSTISTCNGIILQGAGGTGFSSYTHGASRLLYTGTPGTTSPPVVVVTFQGPGRGGGIRDLVIDGNFKAVVYTNSSSTGGVRIAKLNQWAYGYFRFQGIGWTRGPALELTTYTATVGSALGSCNNVFDQTLLKLQPGDASAGDHRAGWIQAGQLAYEPSGVLLDGDPTLTWDSCSNLFLNLEVEQGGGPSSMAGSTYAGGYGIKLKYADNNQFIRPNVYYWGGSHLGTGILFDPATGSAAAFPHSNSFVSPVAGLGWGGTVGTGRNNLALGWTGTGECSYNCAISPTLLTELSPSTVSLDSPSTTNKWLSFNDSATELASFRRGPGNGASPTGRGTELWSLDCAAASSCASALFATFLEGTYTDTAGHPRALDLSTDYSNPLLVMENHITGDTAARTGFYTMYSQGTKASPTAAGSTDRSAMWINRVYDGSAWQNSASIEFYMAGTVSSGNTPTKIEFQTTSTGSSGRAARLRIPPTGGAQLISISTGTCDSNAAGTLIFTSGSPSHLYLCADSAWRTLY